MTEERKSKLRVAAHGMAADVILGLARRTDCVPPGAPLDEVAFLLETLRAIADSIRTGGGN